MRRTWSKYINKNKYSECQLITALNAYYYLTGKQYCQQDSQEYEDLVDLVHARHGGAISIEKAWKKLGIEIVWEGISLWDFLDKDKTPSLQLPIEFNIWSKGYGFHSTLIVDYNRKCDALRITNFKKETTSQGWIFREDVYKYQSFCDQLDYDTYRMFGLKGDKSNTSLKREWKKDKKKFFKVYRDRYIEKCKECGVK
jgi:hypothetical protein